MEGKKSERGNKERVRGKERRITYQRGKNKMYMIFRKREMEKKGKRIKNNCKRKGKYERKEKKGEGKIKDKS